MLGVERQVMTRPGMWLKVFILPVGPLEGVDLIWIWIFQKTVVIFFFNIYKT